MNGHLYEIGDPAELASELRALAHRVDNGPVGAFIDDAVFSAAQRLMEVLEVVTKAAEVDRDLTPEDF